MMDGSPRPMATPMVRGSRWSCRGAKKGMHLLGQLLYWILGEVLCLGLEVSKVRSGNGGSEGG